MPPHAAQYPEQQVHSRIPMSVPDWRQPQGLRGRPGFKPTCRAEFAAWTASGRAGLGAGGRRQGRGGLSGRAKLRPVGGCRGACGAWPRCRRAAAGPGRASRSITPSRRLACGDLAGGPPPTGTHSGQALRAGQDAWAAAHGAARPSRHPGTPKGRVPQYPPLTQPLPRRGSGRMTVSPGDGDASTGTCRQRRPLPGQPRQSDRRSPCAHDAEPHRYSDRWPEPRARRNRSSRR